MNIMTEDKEKQLTVFFENGPVSNADDFTPQIPDASQFYCDAMNDEIINSVLNDVKPELIVLIGFADYGKSTFVGSLYQYLMNVGGAEGYHLYDSDTYSGFERRFYLRNIKNDENTKSKILRTDEDDGYMLTLNFYHPSSREKKQIVISDRPGETYKKYVDTKMVIQKDQSLPRAQRVLLFVDSVQMCEEWDVLQEKFRLLFTGLKENSKMPNDAAYDIIFNKIDLVNSDPAKRVIFERIKSNVVSFFESQLNSDAVIGVVELDSKHVHNNNSFIKYIGNLLKKDETLKNKETRLKKNLDCVNELLK